MKCQVLSPCVAPYPRPLALASFRVCFCCGWCTRYVTPGSVDLQVFDPDRTAPAPFCEHYGSGPVYGFIARLSLEKGPGLFMAAASILVHSMGLHNAR